MNNSYNHEELQKYYTGYNGFQRDLANLISHCKTNRNHGYTFVLFAKDISHVKLSDSDIHEVMFRVFWSYTHAIVRNIDQPNCNGVTDKRKSFCKLTGYPVFSLGLGGIMPVKQTLKEFHALEKLTLEQRQQFKDMLMEVKGYMLDELRVFLLGQQKELIGNADYKEFVQSVANDVDIICNNVVTEIEEVTEWI